jgi:hypothetical protein
MNARKWLASVFGRVTPWWYVSVVLREYTIILLRKYIPMILPFKKIEMALQTFTDVVKIRRAVLELKCVYWRTDRQTDD